MSELEARIARLTPEQRAKLEKRLAEAQAKAVPASVFTRDPNAPIPLSSPQARLWLLTKLDPDMVLFNQPTVWKLWGHADAEALKRALDLIVARHEPLRTGLRVVNGEPAQVVQSDARLEFEIFDLEGMAAEEREDEIARFVQGMTRRPFDLAKDVLLRAALIRLGQDENRLVTVRHHIASDAWSVAIFNRELGAAYSAFAAGEEPILPMLTARYADFAVRQNERMQGNWYEEEMAFWRAKVGDVPNLELPTDRTRPTRLTYRGEQLVFPIGTELREGLHELSRREGVTLFMLMLAALDILLGRYARQDDFAVGTNILGRDRPEYENLIGYFANVLTLRADLAGEPTFRELLGRTRKTVLEAFAHREMPFEKIIWDLHRTRDESRTPLFQVLFQTTTVDFRVTGLKGLEVTTTFFDPHTSEYDISVDVRDGANGMTCAFRYATDLFDRETMERMGRQYERLLRGIVAQPDARIGDFDILDEQEHVPVTETWNATDAEFPRERCIHELVEGRAAESPDAVAVVWQDRALTYRELNARANQLARYLRAQGAGADDCVAICAERSLEMLVAVLGVLKAGGAYLPLEPTNPKARLEFILKQAGAKIVLTTARAEENLQETGARRFRLDGDWAAIAGESTENLAPIATPSSLAYVIFTSGTTGQPKGVMVEQHSLVNHATFFAKYYGLTTKDRVLQFAPLAFDFAAEEIFPAWLAGAAVVIRPGEDALAPREFLQFVERNGITMLDLPTAFWHTLVNAMAEFDLELPPSVRLVIVGGEKASVRSLYRWRERVGEQVRWVNTYGPTEATIAVTTHEPQHLPPLDAELPIGRPIANAKLFVLDAQKRPVPIGMPGELYIGGEPVARGYLGGMDDEDTASNVNRETSGLVSPFGIWEGRRVYRTGDLARWRADGTVEFRGRADGQVKLRGFRIELGEIEQALAEHDAVSQCAVTVQEDGLGEKRLVGYVVSTKDQSLKTRDEALSEGEIRAWLTARLPVYMVPSAFVFLDALPMTGNGKVNVRALPAADFVGKAAEEFVPPQTKMQEMVAEIWKQVLGVPRVGLYDDFFLLGGHSLLATLALARAEQQLGQTIALRTLFEHPRLEDWAKILEKNASVQDAPPPIVAVERARYRRAVKPVETARNSESPNGV